MSAETKTDKKVLEIEPTINEYYGIDDDKVNDVSTEQKSMIQASLQKKLERVTKDYHMHLRGRIIDLIDKKNWADFGLVAAPGQKPDPKFEVATYHKDPNKYEKRYEKEVMGYTDPKMGGMFPDKWETRKTYDAVLLKDKQNISNLNTIAKKFGIVLKAYRE